MSPKRGFGNFGWLKKKQGLLIISRKLKVNIFLVILKISGGKK